MNTELIEENAHRLLGAMTGAATTAMVAVGDQLGLYRALADGGPATHDELAAALAHARKALAPDGAVLVVEPNAADDYAANLASPMAALSYAAYDWRLGRARATAVPGSGPAGATAPALSCAAGARPCLAARCRRR